MASKSEIGYLHNQSLKLPPLKKKPLSSTELNLQNTDSFLQCLGRQKAYAWTLSPVTRSSSLGKEVSVTSLILWQFFITLCPMYCTKLLPSGPSSGLWNHCPHLLGRRQLMCSYLGLSPSHPSAPKFSHSFLLRHGPRLLGHPLLRVLLLVRDTFEIQMA